MCPGALHGGSARPLCEAVRGEAWIAVGISRRWGCQSYGTPVKESCWQCETRMATDSVGKQPKREKYVSVNKAGRSRSSEE